MTYLTVLLLSLAVGLFWGQGGPRAEMTSMVDKNVTMAELKDHVRALTVDIGERSVRRPENLARTEAYIVSFYRDLGISVKTAPYSYRDVTVANVVADVAFKNDAAERFLVGAHYDSVAGTVGADDNASAVAVQLETARHLAALAPPEDLDLTVRFVFFALEEPPAFDTPQMGSRVYARQAKRSGEKIDGMICLEMVGYTCSTPGCQNYPFPLMFFDYPDTGEFIGIVGNLRSRGLTRSLARAFKQNPELPVIPLTVPLRGWLMPSIRLSDHSAFWDHGFKAVMITDSAFYRNPDYHLPSDTMEKLDYGFMAEVVESLVGFFSSR